MFFLYWSRDKLKILQQTTVYRNEVSYTLEILLKPLRAWVSDRVSAYWPFKNES